MICAETNSKFVHFQVPSLISNSQNIGFRKFLVQSEKKRVHGLGLESGMWRLGFWLKEFRDLGFRDLGI